MTLKYKPKPTIDNEYATDSPTDTRDRIEIDEYIHDMNNFINSDIYSKCTLLTSTSGLANPHRYMIDIHKGVGTTINYGKDSSAKCSTTLNFDFNYSSSEVLTPKSITLESSRQERESSSLQDNRHSRRFQKIELSNTIRSTEENSIQKTNSKETNNSETITTTKDFQDSHTKNKDEINGEESGTTTTKENSRQISGGGSVSAEGSYTDTENESKFKKRRWKPLSRLSKNASSIILKKDVLAEQCRKRPIWNLSEINTDKSKRGRIYLGDTLDCGTYSLSIRSDKIEIREYYTGNEEVLWKNLDGEVDYAQINPFDGTFVIADVTNRQPIGSIGKSDTKATAPYKMKCIGNSKVSITNSEGVTLSTLITGNNVAYYINKNGKKDTLNRKEIKIMVNNYGQLLFSSNSKTTGSKKEYGKYTAKYDTVTKLTTSKLVAMVQCKLPGPSG
ncbi:hypothetical protein H8356DRAFT_1391325 [Neocallimastix lanati (nom. inval.)]|nr:hypothetical protein H8356DRAFT_1391325 [Neocallimastix sp. JGI-2020a]